jgi:hypothetical protein
MERDPKPFGQSNFCLRTKREGIVWHAQRKNRKIEGKENKLVKKEISLKGSKGGKGQRHKKIYEKN